MQFEFKQEGLRGLKRLLCSKLRFEQKIADQG